MAHSENICKKEAARLLNISPSTFYRLVKKGELNHPFPMGGRSFYKRVEILGYNEAQQQKRGFQKQRSGLARCQKNSTKRN